MAGSRAAAEDQTGYTSEELTLGYALKDRLGLTKKKSLAKPKREEQEDKSQTGREIQRYRDEESGG